MVLCTCCYCAAVSFFFVVIEDLEGINAFCGLCCFGCIWGIGELTWIIAGCILRWSKAGQICSGVDNYGLGTEQGLLL